MRSQIKQGQEQLARLEQKLRDLQNPKRKHQKAPASQIKETREQIAKAKQDVAYLESLYSQYLALSQHDINKQAERLRYQLERTFERLFSAPCPATKHPASLISIDANRSTCLLIR